jgi:hypothetical protein
MGQLRRDLKRRGWLGCALAALLAIYGYTCGGSPTSASRAIPTGAWGGTSVALNVTQDGATLQFDCAHGSIGGSPATLDASGRFEVAGTFVRERGGPVRVDETPDSHPALYSGTTDGRTMTLTVTLTDSQQPVGTFELGFGKTPRLIRCM